MRHQDEGEIMDAHALAERIAAGNRFQDLTRPTKSLAKNYHYRIWRDGTSVLLKVYGTPARERRESHAIEALQDLGCIPVRIDGSGVEEPAWALFEDPGQWSLGSLPASSDAARRGGVVLRSVHESDPKALTNLTRGIDAEWVKVDFASTMRRLARYRGRVGIDAELYEAMATTPPPDASEPRAAHTDPTPEHFILNESGAVTLVDWEWATLAPPEWDLSKAAWLLRIRTGSAAADALQEGYGQTLDPVEMSRWIVYHAAMLLIYEAEQRMSDAGADSYADTVNEILRAIEAAAS
jgi:aminoglycoside phosphotransferase (APT) family kinase protein